MLQAYTILLIGAWLIGSGVVAYVCDNLGRKLGKRRLTLWGLRPRHTATVMTVLAGIAIAAFTIMMVTLVSVDARRAMFQVASLIQEQKDLTRANRFLSRHNRQLFQTASDAEARAQETEARAQRSESRATVAAGKLARVERQRDRVEGSLAAARRQLADLDASREDLASEVAEKQANLSQLSARVRSMEGRLTAALVRARMSGRKASEIHRQLVESQGQLTASRAALSTAASQREALEERLRRATLDTKEAESKRDAAQSRLAGVESDLLARQSELDDRRQAAAQLQQTIDDADRRLKDLNDQIAYLEADLTVKTERARYIREGPVIYATGQEIARRVIYGPSATADVNDQIMKLLDTADEIARSQGAGDDGNNDRCLKLAPYIIPESYGTLTWDEDEQVLQFARRIAADHADVLIRVVSAGNFVRGEPVQAELDIAPNRLIFHRGDVLARKLVDGRLSDAKILETLIGMLQDQVRENALSAGLLPPPSGTVGEINWEQVMDAVRRIRRRKRASEVHVIALTDAWTSDPLFVRFILDS